MAQKNSSTQAGESPATAASRTSSGEKAGDATGQTRFEPDARACRLLPIADIENPFGAKVKLTAGVNDVNNSTCAGMINGYGVQIQTADPGTLGVPATVLEGMQAANMITSQMKKAGSFAEMKDFGSVGCYTVTMVPGKAVYATSCFQVSGGYLVLTLGSENRDQVSFDVVKGFLEKAAARRK